MNAILFVFRQVFKVRSFSLILGLLNVATVALLIVITTEFNIPTIQTLNYILFISALLLISTTIILCMNSEFAHRTRDISILRAIGFQGFFIWSFFVMKSFIIGIMGSLIGFTIGNIILYILFNTNPRLLLIFDVLILAIISALIGCLSPLVRILRLNVPELLNR